MAITMMYPCHDNENQKDKNKKRILLLEDNPMIQHIHGLYLEEMGYTYDLASTGKEAIALYNKNKYWLMLLDKQLPDIDGIEFCEFVRSEYSREELPIFILTAGDSSSEKTCRRAGCNEFFVKPINKKKLRKAIHEWTKE